MNMSTSISRSCLVLCSLEDQVSLFPVLWDYLKKYGQEYKILLISNNKVSGKEFKAIESLAQIRKELSKENNHRKLIWNVEAFKRQKI